MHYYIDGYNLLFRTFGLSEGNFEQQRKQLIYKLEETISCLALNVTIVFDAHLRLGDLHHFHFADLHILFTPAGQNADEYILAALDHTLRPKLETIITSDKELAWRARHKGARTESVEEFLKWLNKRYVAKTKRKRSVSQSVSLHLPETLISKRPPKAPEVPPANASTAQQIEAGSLEYYLDIFEKKLHDQAAIESTRAHTERKGKQRLHKSKKKHTSPEQEPQSEMARWLKIFEERDKEQ